MSKAKDKTKFAVGDRVTVKGEAGTVTEAPELAPDYLAKFGQFYTVRLDSWEKVELPYVDKENAAKVVVSYKHPKTGAVRDHEADTLGCVPEADIKAV